MILYRLVYCLFDIGLQTIAVTHCSILTFILNDIVLCLNCSTFHLQWYKSCIRKHLTNLIQSWYRSGALHHLFIWLVDLLTDVSFCPVFLFVMKLSCEIILKYKNWLDLCDWLFVIHQNNIHLLYLSFLYCFPFVYFLTDLFFALNDYLSSVKIMYFKIYSLLILLFLSICLIDYLLMIGIISVYHL